MYTTILCLALAILICFLILKFSCVDHDKEQLKIHNLYKTDKEYYEDRPSKRESRAMITIAIIGMVVVFVVLGLSNLYN